ncbi:MAG: HAMP domain-containing histidine kinase [Planctomycetes bacterium]|nr:HAMP domain-containing histidine kinase [Planctomycetota bacterium]MCC7399564.1 HAMP domain-containing histidine kinase [Planctomycetota bacterium]
MTEPGSRRRRSLRRAVAIAFLPLGIVIVAGAAIELWIARSVHQDVLRLFEELREVALARSMVDEIEGLQQWIVAAPTATAATQPLVLADVRHHEHSARETMAHFRRPDDPSRPQHDRDERRLVEQLQQGLADIGKLLTDDRPLAELAAPASTTLQAAQALVVAVDAESREIGDGLDVRSDDMGRFLLLVAGLSGLTLIGLGWLLLRRVLQPVRHLRDAVEHFDGTRLELPPTLLRGDEIGQLAAAFQTMADQIREHHLGLEQRVAERSREVLRTAKLAQLGTLAAGVAHEINNPLASIVACADGLLRELEQAGGGVPEDLRDYLQILRKEGLRARDVTARLLRFAHQDHSRHEAVWLGAEAREVAAMFAHQMEDAGVTLRLQSEENGPAIAGDPAEWRQVLFNLLRNALDVSPRGGRIDLDVRRRGGEVVLSIEDDGPGVANEHLDRIFEPFFTTKPVGRGTGLGLAIVHRIVTGVGGRVAVDRQARGARISITLPAAP